MAKGYFIVFEGPDGSGKTTISTGVFERLKAEGYSVIYTREPGGIDIAEQIRNVILDPKNTAMDARTEALLYAASRRQHLVEKVLPALAEGKIVLCDRFVYSSLAYQGCGRHLGMEAVMDINRFAIENYMPDKTIFLDVPVERGLSRLEARAFKDRLDVETLQFHKDTYEGYQRVLEQYKDSMIVVDASRTKEEVLEETYKIVKDIIHE
ncbi:MAG: dTMP kinase [Erysipelotrichaceae bacterium]|nr:dTMP kinase [Erysipelotrichaceae bacterium]